MSGAIRKFWFKVVGKNNCSSGASDQAVIIHDPAARGPRDLDDPFLDQNAQARIGTAIAHAVEKNHEHSELQSQEDKRKAEPSGPPRE